MTSTAIGKLGWQTATATAFGYLGGAVYGAIIGVSKHQFGIVAATFCIADMVFTNLISTAKTKYDLNKSTVHLLKTGLFALNAMDTIATLASLNLLGPMSHGIFSGHIIFEVIKGLNNTYTAYNEEHRLPVPA